ncbi:MAG TPA: 5'/3'-nucleotidase SurE [Phototrophicaceae bacterium]|jgi:5'-nucleotidase|nr:5'/3'-nucleotidase SurE [Phototrophicaceae bacterium]
MTYILVTNDDGVHAPGILALAQAMRNLGEIEVTAPATNQSASGHKKTLFQPMPIESTTLADGTPALAVGGSPADCIALSALGLSVRWPPRLVVSGINRGANLGQDVTYSGTVTAALEATINGVPAVAISLENRLADKVEDYAAAAQVAVAVVRRALEKPLPAFTILNVNVPKGEVKGIRLARQGLRIYHDELEIQSDGNSYRIVGPEPTGNVDSPGTDLWAINQGYASITPIHLDLTAHQFMAELATWDIVL